jgi:hypothetical protein
MSLVISGCETASEEGTVSTDQTTIITEDPTPDVIIHDPAPRINRSAPRRK